MISSLFSKASSFFTQYSPCRICRLPTEPNVVREAQKDLLPQAQYSSFSNPSGPKETGKPIMGGKALNL